MQRIESYVQKTIKDRGILPKELELKHGFGSGEIVLLQVVVDARHGRPEIGNPRIAGNTGAGKHADLLHPALSDRRRNPVDCTITIQNGGLVVIGIVDCNAF